ncbi:MAG TPA: hypothetical protein VHT03_15780 [Rhizomicrobium sp.]|jgi:hypothetical protein|nr:hypothetical protein [Rhizomicrobium sp.]
MKTRFALAAALSMAVPAHAGSGSYTGNYLVSLTHDVYLTTQGYTGHGPNSTHCLALTDDGSIGWPHSGYAVMDNDINTSGQFSVIDNTILIYIYAPGSNDSIASYLFSARASDGKIAQHGAFDYIQGGTSYDADRATFGANGSC